MAGGWQQRLGHMHLSGSPETQPTPAPAVRSFGFSVPFLNICFSALPFELTSAPTGIVPCWTGAPEESGGGGGTSSVLMSRWVFTGQSQQECVYMCVPVIFGIPRLLSLFVCIHPAESAG